MMISSNVFFNHAWMVDVSTPVKKRFKTVAD